LSRARSPLDQLEQRRREDTAGRRRWKEWLDKLGALRASAGACDEQGERLRRREERDKEKHEAVLATRDNETLRTGARSDWKGMVRSLKEAEETSVDEKRTEAIVSTRAWTVARLRDRILRRGGTLCPGDWNEIMRDSKQKLHDTLPKRKSKRSASVAVASSPLDGEEDLTDVVVAPLGTSKKLGATLRRLQKGAMTRVARGISASSDGLMDTAQWDQLFDGLSEMERQAREDERAVHIELAGLSLLCCVARVRRVAELSSSTAMKQTLTEAVVAPADAAESGLRGGEELRKMQGVLEDKVVQCMNEVEADLVPPAKLLVDKFTRARRQLVIRAEAVAGSLEATSLTEFIADIDVEASSIIVDDITETKGISDAEHLVDTTMARAVKSDKFVNSFIGPAAIPWRAMARRLAATAGRELPDEATSEGASEESVAGTWSVEDAGRLLAKGERIIRDGLKDQRVGEEKTAEDITAALDALLKEVQEATLEHKATLPPPPPRATEQQWEALRGRLLDSGFFELLEEGQTMIEKEGAASGGKLDEEAWGRVCHKTKTEMEALLKAQRIAALRKAEDTAGWQQWKEIRRQVLDAAGDAVPVRNEAKRIIKQADAKVEAIKSKTSDGMVTKVRWQPVLDKGNQAIAHITALKTRYEASKAQATAVAD